MSHKKKKPDIGEGLWGPGRDFNSRLRKLLGSEAEADEFFRSVEELSNKGPRALRLNPLKADQDRVFAESSPWRLLEAVPWVASGAYFFQLKEDKELRAQPCVGAALCTLQEAGAMEAVEILNPLPGERVLDLCAAPGAKATQIAERLNGLGFLVANDPVRGRAARLDLLLSRLGALNVAVYSAEPRQLSSRFEASFDKILVDAPCSGESLFAKRKEWRKDVRDNDVLGCARRQFAIISEAAKMLRVGGRLLYSTCTYSTEENEDLIRSFILSQKDLGLEWNCLKEQRRWPHIDQVAGGYVALLELKQRNESADELAASETMAQQRVDLTLHGLGQVPEQTNGLLRWGARRWNLDWDSYALCMAAKLDHGLNVNELAERSQEATWIDIDLGLAEARAYLKGEALARPAQGAQSQLFRLLWEAWPVGLAKGTEGRLNNMLPKGLRELF